MCGPSSTLALLIILWLPTECLVSNEGKGFSLIFWQQNACSPCQCSALTPEWCSARNVGTAKRRSMEIQFMKKRNIKHFIFKEKQLQRSIKTQAFAFFNVRPNNNDSFWRKIFFFKLRFFSCFIRNILNQWLLNRKWEDFGPSWIVSGNFNSTFFPVGSLVHHSKTYEQNFAL